MANSKFQLVPNTWEELRAALGMVLVFVAIILSWANINTQLALLNQKTDSIITSQADTKAMVQTNTDKIAGLQNDLTRLDTIVADAQARGLLTRASSPSNNTLAASNPTPTQQPVNRSAAQPELASSQPAGNSAQPVIINNNVQPTSTPQPTPQPQRPQPSPTSQVPVLGPILDALGL